MFKNKKHNHKKDSSAIIPEFDIWPPKDKKTKILKNQSPNLPRNKSYRDANTHQDTSDMAVYEPTTTDSLKKHYEDV